MAVKALLSWWGGSQSHERLRRPVRCDLPENLVGKIIQGRLVTHPRPAPRHARSYSSLGMQIGGPYDLGRGRPGGWWILDEPELHQVITSWCPPWPAGAASACLGCPTPPGPSWLWTGSARSCHPPSARLDRAEKLPLYAGVGVGHAWLVDPDLRLLEAYENRLDGRWLLLGSFQDDATVPIPPFEAVDLELALLWAD